MFTQKLHILPQQFWHEPAFVVGDCEGLLILKNAIERALADGEAFSDCVFATDGEGYNIAIACRENMDDVPLGYVGEYAEDKREYPDWLIDIVKRGYENAS